MKTYHVNTRNPERDSAIAVARASLPAFAVGVQYNLTAGAVRGICARIRKEKAYELRIGRPGERLVQVGRIVTHKGFVAACIGAYRTFGVIRELGLPGWFLTDGEKEMTIEAIREAIANRGAHVAAESSD